jgi:serine/threonine-protein kinase
MVLADARRIGVRSDVYLLGAVLHEIVTGSPRHLGATLMEALGAALRSKPFAYGPNVPTGLASICNRATAAAIDERYESADALRLALAEFLRNRHSLQLSGAALARLAPLRMLVEEADPKDEDAEEELFSAFGECRFALQESLRQWPDNDEAKQGLQELLELMVARELAAEDYNAARRLLRELPKPCPALELRLGELRDKIDAERATVESLRNLGHRTDRSIGKRERALIMAAMAVIWTAIYFALGYLTRSGTLRATHETFMLVNVSYGVFLFIAMRVWKKTLWETEVNKRFLWTLWAAFAAGALFWPAARILQLPFGWSLAITMLLYATIVWMSAAAVDPRLIWVTPPYAVGFLAALAAPAYGWEVMGIATAVAMTTATLVWRPSSSGDTSSLPPLMGRSDPPGSRDGAR